MEENKNINLCKCGCGKEVTYNKYKTRKYIHGHNGVGKKHSEEYKRKMSIARMGNKNPMFNQGRIFKKIENRDNFIKLLKKHNYNICALSRDLGCKRDILYIYIERFNIIWDKKKTIGEVIRDRTLGKKRSKKTKLKIKKNHAHFWKGKEGPAKGTKHKEDSKIKMRTSSIKYIKSCKTQNHVRYSKKACEFFDKVNNTFDINIQHAENNKEFFIKELRFWVDGYEKEKNIVFEWNEMSHYFDGKLTNKHKIRQNKIKKFLKCKFVNINEKTFNEKNMINKIGKLLYEGKNK